MPMVTMANHKNKLDGSVHQAAYKFLQKLQADDTTPGLHIEPMVNARDDRARTGRVNKQWRAVLYKITSDMGNHYVYMGTYPHDEAIEIARSHVLKMNLALGVPEFQKIVDEDVPALAATPNVSTEVRSALEPENPEPVASEPDWENHLGKHWTQETLVQEAGITSERATKALAATTMSELHAVIDDAPEAQGLVLLGLANGRDFDEIKDELGLEPLEAGDEETQLAESLRKASVGFVYVGDNPDELKDALESKNFDSWRVFLHPEQRRFAEQNTSGAYRLSGGAGTGKTVVLVHRARNLAKKYPQARIILSTFTKVLAESLQSQLKNLDASVQQVQRIGTPGVAVLGLDQIAAQVVAQTEPKELTEATQKVLGPTANSLAGRTLNVHEAFETATRIAQPDLTADLCHPSFLEQEYVSVVLAHRIVDETAYVRANRKGRGTALGRKQRKELWKVFHQFRRDQQLTNQVTFPEVATIAAAILEDRVERGASLPADHVLVDEGQDLHSGHWAMLRAIVPEGPDDLFIAEDSHQRIYGQKVPLSRFGINIVGRARRLRLNYRTTAENLALAVRVLDGGDYTDLEDIPEDASGYQSVRSGPRPHLVAAGSLRQQIVEAAKFIRSWVDDGVAPDAIGVMVRSERIKDQVERGLRDDEALAPNTGSDSAVQIITMHSAKGMEFERAIIIGAGADQIPAAWQLADLPESEQHDIELRERSLLYVAATRARDELVITWAGEVSGYLTRVS